MTCFPPAPGGEAAEKFKDVAKILRMIIDHLKADIGDESDYVEWCRMRELRRIEELTYALEKEGKHDG